MLKAYKEDLAYIHDKGFGGFAENSEAGLLDLLRHNGISEGLVVDMGCGSGIWAQVLILAGYDVFGIDISAAMLRIARKRAPKARFRNASIFQADLPTCDVVTAIGECLNYRFDQSNSKRSLKSLFRRIFEALRPGGIFIFDVHGPGASEKPVPTRSYYEGDDWVALVETHEHSKSRTLNREITSFRKDGELYRRSEERHSLLLHRRAELSETLRDVGFRVRYLRGYGQLRFSSRHFGILARRPA